MGRGAEWREGGGGMGADCSEMERGVASCGGVGREMKEAGWRDVRIGVRVRICCSRVGAA